MHSTFLSSDVEAGEENIFEVAQHGFQIPVIHQSPYFNNQGGFFLASCASLDPCEENLSTAHFLHSCIIK